ncbi:xylulose kinase [Planctomycetota bacterium]|jgi:xylulokinase|nr:xylulose kinase [Planctomycetota bacterium]
MANARSLFLGFDVGTQSTKAVLIDAASHTVVARSSVLHGLIEGLPAGHAEQHPDVWQAAVVTTARAVLAGKDPALIGGIGVSGQQHGCVVLDQQDRVVRPAKLWCDTSTAIEAQELSQALGRAVPTGFTASKLTWLKRHEPANWTRVRSVLLPHDYINFCLTGVKAMECGDASGTGLFDVQARSFDARAIAAIDPRLAAMLPPLVAAGAVTGTLCAAFAQLLGLPFGIPVATGGGDNMMAAIGSGATKAGVVVISLGTSGTVFTRTEQPVVDPNGLIAPFCSSDGGWLPLLCVMNLTGVTEQVKALTGLGHQELTAKAQGTNVGCDGLLWLPYLQGERVPDLPTATGTLLGMRAGLLQPGHLYRAALEGTSLNLAWGVDRMRALGVQIGEVRLVGGAANNVLWRQILADLLAVPVVKLLEVEAAALGAAIQALWTVRRAAGEMVGCDEVAAPFVQTGERTLPDAARVAKYRLLSQHFRDTVQRLHPAS